MQPVLALPRPMAGLAIAQALGIAGAFTLPASSLVFPLTVSLFLLAVLAHIRANPIVLCIPFLFFAGWLSLMPWIGASFPDNHVVHFLDAGTLRVSCTIAERPVHFAHRSQFVAAVDKIGADGPLKGRIKVTVRPSFPELTKGTRLAFDAEIRTLRNFSNPGGFDYIRYMRFQNVFGTAYVRGKDALKLVETPTSFMTHVRKELAALIHDCAPENAQPLFQALLLGEKKHISQETRDLFANAGIAHILAISGLHIGMVALFAFQMFRLILSCSPKILLSGRLFSICAVLTMIPVLFYGFLTGMAPSTQRAVIMVSVFLMAYVFDRDYDSLNTLATAAIIILAWHAPALFDVGFQLSFSAVFCILYGLKKFPFRTIPITWGDRVRRRVFIYFLIPVIASVGTAPIVLHYFDRVSLVGPLANLILVPLIGCIILPLSLSACLIYPALPWISSLMIFLAGFMLQGVLELAHLLASVPFASIMPIKPNAWEILIYYLALLSLMHVKKRWGQCLLILCLIGALADGGYWLNQRFGNQELRVTCLDVGQGSSALVEFPHGPCMLVDGGGLSASSTFDTGRMIIAPFLWQKKIHTIEYLVLTHPQHDHAGGLGYMAERFGVKEFWSNGQPSPIHAYEHLTAACERKGVLSPTLEDLHQPRIIRGVTARVLHPAPGFEARLGNELQLNENSLVLKLSLGDQSVLFTGDIGGQGENTLLERCGSDILNATLLTAPHHGSRTSSSLAFVEAVRPEHVVFSTGYRNWYGFPHGEVVKRYRKMKAKTYNTGTQGACTFATTGKQWAGKAFFDLSPN